MSDYLADVRRYDAGADEEHVKKIVKHLGIALRNKDSSLVSCSDQTELDRVREKWCVKKFGATDTAKSDSIIAKVCDSMKSDKQKSRVTFYYLVAKHLGKLGAL
jgi:3-dehydroquinate synthetase